MYELLKIQEIKAKYPDQWVLIGEPVIDEPEINGSITSKLLQGLVLFASKDKRELAYKAREIKGNIGITACIYTGEISKNRLFLL
jgi:hypothetical protein